MKDILEKYKGKKVLITGNTGFKGSWLTKILLNAGAVVAGYALEPLTEANLFSSAGLNVEQSLYQKYGDIRNLDMIKNVFREFKPEIVFHLAAQPIVRDSYRDPVGTYSTNVMGTVHICECIRLSNIPISEGGLKSSGWDGVKSFLNVTTDKVYKNYAWEYGYREEDPLDGYDPYSNSKSCSELVTHSYKASFFTGDKTAISTARAGNVIGGGDFSNDRIIPDCIRTIKAAVNRESKNAEIQVRNPYSTRPYQHVLEPLFAYLTIAIMQYENKSFEGYYNVGPDDKDCVTNGRLVDIFCKKWNEEEQSIVASWKNIAEKNAPHEDTFLKLDCSRIKAKFGWMPRWHIEKAVEEVIQWTRVWMNGGDIAAEMDREIEEYIAENNLNFLQNGN